MTISISVSIDVPDLAAGIAFYCAAFGFVTKSEPAPAVVVLSGLNIEICLLQKAVGSVPSLNNSDRRKFERHWTPIHLDFHVDELHATLQRVEALGGKCEQVFENDEHGSAAFCSDPFGHGFCIIQRKTQRSEI